MFISEYCASQQSVQHAVLHTGLCSVALHCVHRLQASQLELQVHVEAVDIRMLGQSSLIYCQQQAAALPEAHAGNLLVAYRW